MKEQEVRDRAFAMPLTQPAYPRGPYRFADREYFIITYRTDPEKTLRLPPTDCSAHARLITCIQQDEERQDVRHKVFGCFG